MSGLRSLVDSILVPHSAFQVASRRIGQCVSYVEGKAYEPVCVALIGESRTGKSRCVEALQRKHPTVRRADGLHVPVLSIAVPSRPTVKSLAELILEALGAPDWDKGTENAKTIRLKKLMGDCEVLVLALDEFHHFYDKSSHTVQHHVADWLKNLVGDARVALVVSGLPSLQAVIDQNEQLAGRFSAPVRMPRFNWLDDDLRGEWLAILEAFTVGVRREFDLPALDGEELALRTYCATGGLIGYLAKTLRQAVWNAIDADTRKITVHQLRDAHVQAVWAAETLIGGPSPFDISRPICPSLETLAQAQKVGVRVEPPPKPRGRRGRSQPAASSILVR